MCFPTVAAMSIWFWLVRLAIVHNHTMGSLFLSLLGALRSAFRTHADLVVENLALAPAAGQLPAHLDPPAPTQE